MNIYRVIRVPRNRQIQVIEDHLQLTMAEGQVSLVTNTDRVTKVTGTQQKKGLRSQL